MTRAALLLLALLLAAAANADTAPKPAKPAVPAKASDAAKAEAASHAQIAAQRDADWAAQLKAMQSKRDDARVRVAAAEAALTSARHRHYPRGEALGDLENDLAQAREDLSDASERFPEMIEEARTAGVSAKVLAPFEEAAGE